MIRIIGSLLVLLGCFAVAVTKGWILLPQACCVAIGLCAYTALMAEVNSD